MANWLYDTPTWNQGLSPWNRGGMLSNSQQGMLTPPQWPGYSQGGGSPTVPGGTQQPGTVPQQTTPYLPPPSTAGSGGGGGGSGGAGLLGPALGAVGTAARFIPGLLGGSGAGAGAGVGAGVGTAAAGGGAGLGAASTAGSAAGATAATLDGGGTSAALLGADVAPAGGGWLASAMPVLGPAAVLGTAAMGAWMTSQVPEGTHGGNIYYRPTADGFLEISDSAFNKSPSGPAMQQAQQQVAQLNDWLRQNNYRFNPQQPTQGQTSANGLGTGPVAPGPLFNTAYGEAWTDNPSNLFDHVGWRSNEWLRGLTPEAQARLGQTYNGWNQFAGQGGPQWGDAYGYHAQRPERDQMETRMAGGVGMAGLNTYDQRLGSQMYNYFRGHDYGGMLNPDNQGEAGGGWNPDALWGQFAPQRSGPTPGPAMPIDPYQFQSVG